MNAMKSERAQGVSRAFSLIELLVVIAIVAVVTSLLLPALSGARDSARGVRCSSNQRQLITAWMLYANDYKDRAMPLAYWSLEDIGSGPQVFWWGTHGTTSTPPEYDKGFIAPYLEASLRNGSVFECPNQPWGSYKPQGPSKTITSTYGYNGYYLCPSKTPGWAFSIAQRPWQRLSGIQQPTMLMVFADTLLPAPAGGQPGNNALLDPPLLFSSGSGGSWRANPSPTTAFRHRAAGPSRGTGSVIAAHADGHVQAIRGEPGWFIDSAQRIGSVDGSTANGPRYVPDWASWLTVLSDPKS